MQWLLGVPVFVALSLGVAHAELSSSEMLPFSAGSLGVETPASDEDEMFPDEKLLSENELFPGKGPIKIPDINTSPNRITRLYRHFFGRISR